jgi:D-alanyl-D-alanine carboxypeptidase
MSNRAQIVEPKRKNGFFFVAFLLLAMAILFAPMQADARSKSKKKAQKDNPKYAAFVMDAGTGAILHQENANSLRHPASLTKAMTLMLLFDAIDRGRVRLDDRITISKHAASMPPSKLGLKPGGCNISSSYEVRE